MSERSLNKMVAVKAFCQVQPVMRAQTGGNVKFQCVYFCSEEVSCLVCKMVCFQSEGRSFFSPPFFGYTYVGLAAIIFVTRN